MRRAALDGPTIGVALSGGGAAGLAHIGVLEELTLGGIAIRCVAGTSAGAVVGAAYAAGHLAALRKTMCALTRRRVLWLLDPTWPHTGLFEGRRAVELIRKHVGERIEQLPHPYAAVATDLETGEEVILRRGDVVEAIRASAAIPGLFTPQRCQGRLLVDGGLVNPVPVDVARGLGAQFVIAVSVLRIPDDSSLWRQQRSGLSAQLLARFHARIGRDLKPKATTAAPAVKGAKEEVATDLGLVEILSQASSIVQSRIATSRMAEQPPDYFIAIPLPRFGLFDFHRAAEAVAAGRAAARRALPEIRAAAAAAAPLYSRVTRWLDGTARRRHPLRRK